MLTTMDCFVPALRFLGHPFGSIRSTADRLRPLQPQQISPHHKEIRQCTGDEQPVDIFKEPAVMSLGKP